MKNLIAIVFSLLLSIGNARSQFTVQQGTLSTSPASNMNVQGHLLVRSTFDHQGILSLHNNLLCENPLSAPSGTIELVGSNQEVRVASGVLGSLSVNGGGSKQFDGNLTLQRNLSLSDGILQTSKNSRLTLASSARITGGSNKSFIAGFLYRSGTGKKFYPVGKNGSYAPVTLLNVAGDNPTVGVAYFPTSAIAGPEFHWQQRVLDGTYEGSIAQLTFVSDHADYQDYSAELVVLSAEARSDQYTVLGQSSLAVQGNRFTITSDQPTAQAILSVGFDIPEDSKHLYLPNAFSTSAPNDEDRRIKVYGQRVSPQNFYLSIQDMWGTIVYKTTSWEEASTQGWSGSAVTAMIGTTYRFLLEGQYIGGKRFRKTGTIVQY